MYGLRYTTQKRLVLVEDFQEEVSKQSNGTIPYANLHLLLTFFGDTETVKLPK